MRPGMIWEIAIGSFGVAAAGLLVMGWIVLRFYRDRQQFHLMQMALERGITSLPGAVPGWVISMRQGVLSIVLGLGVAFAGMALSASAAHIDEIPATVSFHPPGQNGDRGGNPGGAMEAPPRPPRGPGDGRPPEGNGPERGGPGGGPGGGPPDPVMERWHRVETQKLIGLLAICAGGILLLLGIVRVAFARTERKYGMEVLGTGKMPAAGV